MPVEAKHSAVPEAKVRAIFRVFLLPRLLVPGHSANELERAREGAGRSRPSNPPRAPRDATFRPIIPFWPSSRTRATAPCPERDR